MIKNRKLDYVVSGTSYMRFSNPSVAKDNKHAYRQVSN
jgi:hypothetical protein